MKTTHPVVKAVRSVLIALALPAIVFALMELIVYSKQGVHVINSMLDIKNLIRSAGISTAIAFALSMNLPCGRMDLSLGSQMIAATIVGGLAATGLGLGGVWILLFCVVLGFLFGGLVGTAFVTLRIPPMVLGIGMACILECVGFATSKGLGFSMIGVEGAQTLSNVNFTIAVISMIVAAMLVIMTYTTFSYKFRAVRGSQLIARNAGINVFVNVVLCYSIAGALVAVSGVLDTAFSGAMDAKMGLTSNGGVMAKMFAMMLGCNLLAKYINQAVGVVSAAVALQILSMGLTALNISDALNGCINMALFILYLVWQANSNVFNQYKYDRKRITQAQEKKKQRAAAHS